MLDDGRCSRTDCVENNRQDPVNVSENHLASLEPAANVRNDEILEKLHPPSQAPSTYKFPKQKFGSTVTVITE